jgi:hypothetical protein
MRVEPRQGWRPSLGAGSIHRIGPRIVAIAVVVAVVWLAAILVTDWMRSGQVATWSGPDSTVQSGYALGQCQFPQTPSDRAFPVWLRYGGRLYRFANLTLPVSPQSIGTVYARSGYTLDRLSILTIEDTPAGQARDRVLIYANGADGGAVYEGIDECE